MAEPARLVVVRPLPALHGFRRALAVDRAGLPRSVVLSFAPPDVVDDPTRLDAMLRGVEAAGRVAHPCVAANLGTETVDGALVIVEQHRPGTSLRAIVDAAGRTPPAVAARIGLDVAGALAALHAGDSGRAGLAHGAVGPSSIEVGEEGEVVLCGLGLSPDGDPADDVRGLGAALHECLVGEPPALPPRPLDVPGVPRELADAVDRATGATSPGHGSAAALATALAAFAAPATAADVAAYVEAVLPDDEGRDALRHALQAALADAAPPAPAPGTPRPPGALPADAPAPPAGDLRAGPLDLGQTFPIPHLRRASSRLPLIVGIVALALGFAAGFAAQRAHQPGPGAAAAP